jgi:hypothetical protein
MPFSYVVYKEQRLVGELVRTFLSEERQREGVKETRNCDAALSSQSAGKTRKVLYTTNPPFAETTG